jgi:hypothetical protein
MRRIWLRLLAAISFLALASAATRPHYGGTLRVEIRERFESADPPDSGPGMADLKGGFAISEWQGGRRSVYTAVEDAPGGRPFVDSIEIQLGRALRDRTVDLDLGRTDIVNFGATESRRVGAGRKLWNSAPVRIITLVFSPRVEDARVREALALAVDRTAIYNVLLQRQGEISGALLPQWLSGYAFLFPATADVARARTLASGRTLTLASDDRAISDRIALNARDAGLTVMVVPANVPADVRLTEARILFSDPALALTVVATALGLPEPPRMDNLEALYAAERSLLEGYRVIPLFHVPDAYGAGPRVKGGPGVTPLGEWRFENLWVESGRP